MLVVCVSIFDAKTEVCEGPRARAVRSKAFLFGAEDFSTLDVAGGQHEYGRGPKCVERVG